MTEPRRHILVINPGSTSTKVALFDGDQPVAEENIRHAPETLRAWGGILDQQALRTRYVLDFIAARQVPVESLRAVVGRGGVIQPLESGTYPVNDKMLADLHTGFAATHASSLGALIAADIAGPLHIPAFVVDPVAVDEMEPAAKYSGLPDINRRSLFHALNTKAAARDCAMSLGIRYEDARFVVAHMGGGVSVGAHRCGRVIDVNDALNGEGPFSPERSGGVPLTPLIELCFSGRYTRDELLARVRKRGGMLAYLGTNDMIEVERRMDAGDARAAGVVDAMAYQIAKEIGAMAAVLEGRVDAILLTGGLARSARFVERIARRVSAFGQVLCRPGEMEMRALALGALRVLDGQEEPKAYMG